MAAASPVHPHTMPPTPPHSPRVCVVTRAIPAAGVLALRTDNGGALHAVNSNGRRSAARKAAASTASQAPRLQRAHSSGAAPRPIRSRHVVRSSDPSLSHIHSPMTERQLPPWPTPVDAALPAANADPPTGATTAPEVSSLADGSVECWEDRLDAADLMAIASSPRRPQPAPAPAPASASARAASIAAKPPQAASPPPIASSKSPVALFIAVDADGISEVDASHSVPMPPSPHAHASPAAASVDSTAPAGANLTPRPQTQPASGRGQPQHGSPSLLSQASAAASSALLATPVHTASAARFPSHRGAVPTQPASANGSPIFSLDTFHPGVAASATTGAAAAPRSRGGRGSSSNGHGGGRSSHSRSLSLNATATGGAPAVLRVPVPPLVAGDPRCMQLHLLSPQAYACHMNWAGAALAIHPDAAAMSALEQRLAQAEARAAQAEERATQAEARVVEAERGASLVKRTDQPGAAAAAAQESQEPQADASSSSTSTPLPAADTRSTTPLLAASSSGSTSISPIPISPFLHALLSTPPDDEQLPLCHVNLLGDLLSASSLSPLHIPSALDADGTAASPDAKPLLSSHFERAFTLADPLASGRGLGALNECFFSAELSAITKRRGEDWASSSLGEDGSASSSAGTAAWSFASSSAGDSDGPSQRNIWASSEQAPLGCPPLMLPLVSRAEAPRNEAPSKPVASAPPPVKVFTPAEVALAQALEATAVCFEHGVMAAVPIDGTRRTAVLAAPEPDAPPAPLLPSPIVRPESSAASSRAPASAPVVSAPLIPSVVTIAASDEKPRASAWTSRPLVAPLAASSSQAASGPSVRASAPGAGDKKGSQGVSVDAGAASRALADQEAREAELALSLAEAEKAAQRAVPRQKAKAAESSWVKVGPGGKPKLTRAQLKEKAKEKERKKVNAARKAKAAKDAKNSSAASSAASSVVPSPAGSAASTPAPSAPSSPSQSATARASRASTPAGEAASHTVPASSQPVSEPMAVAQPAAATVAVAPLQLAFDPPGTSSICRVDPASTSAVSGSLFDVGTTVEYEQPQPQPQPHPHPQQQPPQPPPSPPPQPQPQPAFGEVVAPEAAAPADLVDSEASVPAKTEAASAEVSSSDVSARSNDASASSSAASDPREAAPSEGNPSAKRSELPRRARAKEARSAAGPSYGDRAQQAASHPSSISVLKPIDTSETPPAAQVAAPTQLAPTQRVQVRGGGGATGAAASSSSPGSAAGSHPAPLLISPPSQRRPSPPPPPPPTPMHAQMAPPHSAQQMMALMSPPPSAFAFPPQQAHAPSHVHPHAYTMPLGLMSPPHPPAHSHPAAHSSYYYMPGPHFTPILPQAHLHVQHAHAHAQAYSYAQAQHYQRMAQQQQQQQQMGYNVRPLPPFLPPGQQPHHAPPYWQPRT